MGKFTVVGYYDRADRKHVIGTIEGEHIIRGGYEPYEGGLFADLVEADTWQDAERQVHGEREEKDYDDGDEGGTDFESTMEVHC